MASIYVVDDHPIVPMAVRLALQGAKDLFLQGFTCSPRNAPDVLRNLMPDVLVLDLVFDRLPAFDFIRDCRAMLPSSAIVVFSAIGEDDWVDRACEAGADELVSKTYDVEFLLQRIRALVAKQEERPARSNLLQKPRQSQSSLIIDNVALTPREAELASLLSTGASVQAIAKGLDISSKTVSVHRDNLRAKLKCQSSRELVALLARRL